MSTEYIDTFRAYLRSNHSLRGSDFTHLVDLEEYEYVEGRRKYQRDAMAAQMLELGYSVRSWQPSDPVAYTKTQPWSLLNTTSFAEGVSSYTACPIGAAVRLQSAVNTEMSLLTIMGRIYHG